jgi:hypothetical protein
MQTHVVIDGSVSTVDSDWTRWGVIVNGIVALTSFFLGALSLWLSFKNDRLHRPCCGMSDVTVEVQTPDEIGEVVRLALYVSNVGGGPAIRVNLELEKYGGVRPINPHAYVGMIAPGVENRRYEHTFHLPRRDTPYAGTDVYELSLNWRGLLSDKRWDAYIGPNRSRGRE